MKRIEAAFKNHPLPIVSFFIMLLSFLVNAPTGEMVVSMEWNGIAMAFVMTMTLSGLKKERVVEGIRKSGAVFTHLGSLAAFFAVMAFILSPFITSLFAVSSILPIAISMLEERERKDECASFAAIITLSAIAGGTLLPGGSWHNIALHKSIGDASFLKTMLPFFLISIPAVAISIPLLLGKRMQERTYITGKNEDSNGNKGMKMLYVCFAFITLLSSLSLFRWIDIVIFTIAILLVFDRTVFLKADYSLLLSVVFLSLAGECLAPLMGNFLSTGAVWKEVVATEIIGGLPVALLAAPGVDGQMLLKAVNIGSAGTILSLPALSALKIVGKENRKAFALRYTLLSALLLVLFIAAVLI